MKAEIVTLVFVMLAAMLSPGPDFILVLKNARFGLRHGLATALGIAAGLFVHCSLALAGVAVVLKTSVVLFSVVRLAGAGYLIYLGLKILYALASGSSTINSQIGTFQPISHLRSFMEGLVTNILNPKVTIFILSIFTQFISPEAPLQERVTVAGVILVESAIVWSALGALVQFQWFKAALERGGRYIDGIFGVALVAIGARIAFQR